MIDLAFALAIAGVAAVQELRTRPLPEWLTLGAAIVAPGVHVVGAGVSGAHSLVPLLLAAGSSALGAIACAILPLYLQRRNRIRRADVILFIAFGAALGPTIGLGAELFALSVAFAASAVVTWRLRTARWLPVAPAILCAVFLATVTTST